MIRKLDIIKMINAVINSAPKTLERSELNDESTEKAVGYIFEHDVWDKFTPLKDDIVSFVKLSMIKAKD